ncbi:MAG: GlsB/YeaQ/YmgE family stress response membrane protein [Sphingomonadaceae bacterium]|nr:GlsB/YeaQ/YmgE family stress response membrane protein [Sphingomonadaceae bacterium]
MNNAFAGSSILYFIIAGAIAGAIAKAIHPGRDPGGAIVTILIGIVGAFIGGFLANVLGLGAQGSVIWEIAVAVIGAIILLAIYRAVATRRTV